MKNIKLIPPSYDELEISLFGPGYGEAAAIHIGNDHWILVDSCLSLTTKKPASLEYLEQLHIDVSDAVKLVVATHWHDDHIRGIGSIVDKCKAAQFFMSAALGTNLFKELVNLHKKQFMFATCGLDEFANIFRTLDSRKESGMNYIPIRLAIADKTIYYQQMKFGSNVIDIKIYSLSPSDASLLQAMIAFSDLIPTKEKPKKRILSPLPNHTAIALLIEIKNQNVLLGADLERTTDPATGWSGILDYSTILSGKKAGVYKIPHHGSNNAHDPRVWSEMLLTNPISIVTPFILGQNELPTKADIERLASLTNRLYCTSRPIKHKYKCTNRVVRQELEQATKDVYTGHDGHIRLRRKFTDDSDHWEVELFGDACTL